MEWLRYAEGIIKGESWAPTPLLPAATLSHKLGVDLWFKREDCTPIGSFKFRGALVCMDKLGDLLSDKGVYVASAGNYGIAIAEAGRRFGIPVNVVVPENATPSKKDRIRLCGANLIVHGDDFDDSKQFARDLSTKDGGSFWEDGVVTEMSYGAGTIASEILEQDPNWDVVLVPLGNGSLIKGIASVIKKTHPDTKIIGLVPSGSPAMYEAFKDMLIDGSAESLTYADGLGVRIPISDITEEIKTLVDDVWLVEEENLLPAVNTLIKLEQIITEPSAAISVAALAENIVGLRGKKVVAIITGSLLNMGMLQIILEMDTLI